jgi:hypothetical protein
VTGARNVSVTQLVPGSTGHKNGLAFSGRGLNSSLPSSLHPVSIQLVLYEPPQWSLFFRWVSGLDAFSR